jgi:glycosyltransferase involved in cell wall biosynthesis
MRVLMISGDKNATVPGTNANARLELQKSVVDEIVVVFWGRGSIWPRIPQGHFDVVTVQDPFWRGLFGWVTARRIGARFNVQVHTDLVAQLFIRRLLARMILNRADSIRVVSERIKRDVHAMNTHASITMLPIYVDIPSFKTVHRRPHTGKYIVWIGRFEEEKNPLAAIEVLKDVLKVIPEARMKMYGNGTLAQEINKAAVDLPIEVPGWSDPYQSFQTADVILCTSWYEGYGASIAEALAAGCPVVAPDVGAAREMGAIVVQRDKLASAVIHVLEGGTEGALNPRFVISKTEWARRWRESLE